MLQELTKYLFSHCAPFFSNVKNPFEIKYLGIPGSLQGETTTFIGFTNNSSKPLFVAKIHRHKDTLKQVINEREILTYLSQSQEYFATTVPHLIFCNEIGGSWVICQTIIEGVPMIAPMNSDGTPEINSATENISIVAEWLHVFNGIACTESVTTVEQRQTYLQELVDEFKKSFLLSIKEMEWVELSNRTAQELASKDNFFVTCHGDFCRQNILISRQRKDCCIGVVDWSFSRKNSLPLHDLFFFLSTYFAQNRKYYGINGFIDAFKKSFLEKNAYSDQLRKCIIGFCEREKIDLSTIKTQFVLFLIEQALFERQQSLRSSKNGGLPRFYVYLASQQNMNYKEALNEQLWIHYFRTFVNQHELFIV